MLNRLSVLFAAGFLAADENIFATSENARAELRPIAWKMWMLSEGHRRNMLEPEFEKTGIAIGTSADGVSYITDDFAH